MFYAGGLLDRFPEFVDLQNRQWTKTVSPFDVDVPPCVNADYTIIDSSSTERDDRHTEGNVPTILVHALGLFSDDSMLDWHHHHPEVETEIAKMEPYHAGCDDDSGHVESLANIGTVDGHRFFLFLTRMVNSIRFTKKFHIRNREDDENY